MAAEKLSPEVHQKPERIERQTKQKKLIKSIFVDTGRPLSAAEVHNVSLTIQQNLGIATVYRVIKSLLEDGALTEVFHPRQDTVRYEIKNSEPHFHFWCEKTDRMFPIKGTVPNLDKLLPPGFSHNGQFVMIQGVCNLPEDNLKQLRKV